MSVANPVAEEWLWLVVCCALGAFYLGLGVGANDLGNSFATVVGSKTMTLRTAIWVGICFEILGSMVLGRTITGTVQGGIADLNFFAREPEVFAYGMLCTVFTTGTWQLVAQYWEINVSSGQSLIGSIIGFSLVYGGSDAVLWLVDDKASWPPYKGMVPIVLTWVFSPLFAAVFSALLFFIIRTFVLRRENAHTLAFWVLPPAVLVTSFICIYFVLAKGAKKYITERDPDWTTDDSAWAAAAAAGGLTVLSAVAVVPLLKWVSNKRLNEHGGLDGEKTEQTPKDASVVEVVTDNTVDAEKHAAQAAFNGTDETPTASDVNSDAPAWKRFFKRVWVLLNYGTTVDVHKSVTEDADIARIHAASERFDPRAEHAFCYLQVFSAMCVMFAHGAGEVGYMAGPLTSCWSLYTEGKLSKSAEPPIWATIIGALSMCLGLLLIGWKMVTAMGVKMTRISASRGFCAELSTALTVVIGSQWGLPIAGSQVIVGAVVGVGLLEGNWNSVNWKLFGKTLVSWVITIFLMGITTAALFAQGAYAPSITQGSSLIKYENTVANLSATMMDNYRIALDSFRNATLAGAVPRLDVATLDFQSALLKNMSADATAQASSKQQTADIDRLITYLHTALSLYQADSVLTVGQNNVFPGAQVCNSNATEAISNGQAVPCSAPHLLPKGKASTWPPVQAQPLP